MKKHIIIVLFSLFSQLVFSQNTYEEDAVKVIKITGGTSQMIAVKNQVKNMISEDKFEEFSKEFDEIMPVLYIDLAKIYMEIYSHDELKKIIEFYESPVGIKMSENAPNILRKSMEASNKWNDKLQAILEKYMG